MLSQALTLTHCCRVMAISFLVQFRCLSTRSSWTTVDKINLLFLSAVKFVNTFSFRCHLHCKHCTPFSGIAMVSVSIHLFTVSSWSLQGAPQLFRRLWLSDTSYNKSWVNRKSPPRNTTVQLIHVPSTPYTDWSPRYTSSQTDRRQHHAKIAISYCVRSSTIG